MKTWSMRSGSRFHWQPAPNTTRFGWSLIANDALRAKLRHRELRHAAIERRLERAGRHRIGLILARIR